MRHLILAFSALIVRPASERARDSIEAVAFRIMELEASSSVDRHRTCAP